MSIDPLTHEFPDYTPYHYVHNNPVRLTDPTGMKADSAYTVNIETGEYTVDRDAGLAGGDEYDIINFEKPHPAYKIPGNGQLTQIVPVSHIDEPGYGEPYSIRKLGSRINYNAYTPSQSIVTTDSPIEWLIGSGLGKRMFSVFTRGMISKARTEVT